MKTNARRTMKALWMITVAGLAGVSAPAGEPVPLELELPPPQLVGTLVPIEGLPHLAPARDRARPPRMVPAGTQNLARGKPVTSSDPWPIIGELEFVTDGRKDSYADFFVELDHGLQWLQIDLEQRVGVHAIAVWHYHAEARVYHNVMVQLSDDPDFVNEVTTVFNNDHDNSAGFGAGQDYAYVDTHEGLLIPVDGVRARYIRLYSEGNTSTDTNHYIEVEVHGLPEPLE